MWPSTALPSPLVRHPVCPACYVGDVMRGLRASGGNRDARECGFVAPNTARTARQLAGRAVDVTPQLLQVSGSGEQAPTAPDQRAVRACQRRHMRRPASQVNPNVMVHNRLRFLESRQVRFDPRPATPRHWQVGVRWLQVPEQGHRSHRSSPGGGRSNRKRSHRVPAARSNRSPEAPINLNAADRAVVVGGQSWLRHGGPLHDGSPSTGVCSATALQTLDHAPRLRIEGVKHSWEVRDESSQP